LRGMKLSRCYYDIGTATGLELAASFLSTTSEAASGIGEEKVTGT